MLFTLTYDGPLPSDGNRAEKEAVRRALHPQLAELWTHEPLAGYRAYLRLPAELVNTENKGLSALRTVGEHVYAALVTEPLHLLAEIDVLMLRPERPGRIITGGSGDIDNGLKTLFDALSVPTQQQDVAANARPSSATDPTFTLLEDDKLISRVNVDTDRLLNAPPDDVRLIMRVTVRAHMVTWGNLALIN